MYVLNIRQKYLSACLLATAALLGGVASASAQVPLASAANFTLLGGTNVTCTGGAVRGDVGVSPGSAVSYTNTGCAVAGVIPPASDAAAAAARADFLDAYAGLEILAASYACTQVDGSLAAQILAPGVYCTDAVAKTGVLTLNGPANGVWVFLANGALTGTNFSVVMAGGGQACNVYWAPTVAATFTTSTISGTILAGNTVGGSITLTGGTLTGRALANVALTTTGTTVVGCQAATSAAVPGPRLGE